MSNAASEARLRADGSELRDEHGRQRILHGINLVAKGRTGTYDRQSFRGEWTEDDLRQLADRGLTFVRLGFIWAAIEPEPGRIDVDYLDWLEDQVDALHEAGLWVVLDAHQDLYSQLFSDGAPDWATLTEAAFRPSSLWSDGYLSSTAVQQALDAFWDNAAAPDGIGLQDHFAACWRRVAARLGGHPAVIGYDLCNEPAPGSRSNEIGRLIFTAAAAATDEPLEELLAGWDEEATRSDLLNRLDDVTVHRAIGDAAAGAVADFERRQVAPMMERIRTAVREVDPDTLLLREHSYFANLGIPSGQPPLADQNWAYSPHGYDLTVDTAATAQASDTRAATIFARHAETAERLGVPVVVGEWGGLGGHSGAARHGRFLLDLFDRYGWGWCYWCWHPGFSGSWEQDLLERPRPVAIAGDRTRWAIDLDGVFTVTWDGRPASAPSLLWLPADYQITAADRDGRPVTAESQGHLVTIAAGTGDYRLTAARASKS